MSISIFRNRIGFGFLYVLVFSVAAFGQSGDLQTDLDAAFKKFKLVRLDGQAALRQVKSRQSLIVPTADKNYELSLKPRDLRTVNYRAEVTDAGGTRALERDAVTTFKGTIVGESESKVRLTIDEGKIEGYFFSGNEKFYIEPARNYSPLANAEDSIVYRMEDLLNPEGFVCALEDKIERGEEMIRSDKFQAATTTLRVIEMATEADYAFVTRLEGAAQANNEILGILNLIEGNYETELGLTFDVVFQHAWSAPDPFSETALLSSFRNFWNVNYPQSSVPRDAAHLFTARPNYNGVGLSYYGTICVNPLSAYGYTGRLDVGTIKYVLTAHEIGHNLGANHVGGAQSCDDTIMNAQINNFTPVDFCPFSRGEVSNFVAGGGGSCLSPRVSNQTDQTEFDFDGDGKADEGVFRSSNGAWYLNQSTSGFTGVAFGIPTDRIVPADYDGDGKTDIAVYRLGTWYRLKSSTNTFDGVVFGSADDVPAPADFDGDGKADVVIFRPSDGVWHRLLSANNNYTATAFGTSGDVPVAADYDGDGKADINVFRPSSGAWFRFDSGSGAFNALVFGQDGDKPLAGDFDGDGKTDVAIFRPSNGAWYALRSSDNSLMATAFGFSTDIPAPADYDGDGKTDVSVFRPSSGTWFRLNSSNNSFAATAFGANGDVPIQSAYIQ